MSEKPDPPLESLLAHRRWVRSVARRLLRDEHAAEDLAQEAWVRAMRSPPDPERDPKPWLRRVLKNLASNMRRGEGRRQKRETAWRGTQEQRSPEALVAEAEQHKRLVNLLMDLEEPFKTALVLRFYEGLGPKEIAERLDVPVGTVHSRIARAIERLKTRLDEEENGNRRAWIAGLLPLAGLDRYAPAAAATATTTSIAGILAMTLSKPKIALLTALFVGCLVGGGLWLASDSRGSGPSGDDPAGLLSSDPAPTLEGRGAPLLDSAVSREESNAEAASGPVADVARVVRGTVRDASGSPVAGAEVFALPESAPGIDREDFKQPRYGRTHTASDGTFTLRFLEMRSARVVAFAKGHTAGSVVVGERKPGDPVEVALGEPWRLRVRVEDASGTWPAGCEVDIHDNANDVLDRAVDPRRQAHYEELTAPQSGNTREVALPRTGSVRLFASCPPGTTAVPATTTITQPTDEVTIRILRSAQLKVRVLDASTGQPLPDDARVSGWMGRRGEDVIVWSFTGLGPQQALRSNIAPQSYDLEFKARGYEAWKGKITFHAEGETRTLDVPLRPQGPSVSSGRLILSIVEGKESPKPLLEFARLRGEVLSGRFMMFARMRDGDLKAWSRAWKTSDGWASLALSQREDGSIEVQPAIYPLQDARFPVGTYDIYVAERGRGRAALASNIRVFGDQASRYDVRLEPGTMIALRDVLPKDEVFTAFEVRTAEAGSMPVLALYAAGSHVFSSPDNLEYLLRVPRKPTLLGPYPAASVEVRTVDGKQQTRTINVRGPGTVVR